MPPPPPVPPVTVSVNVVVALVTPVPAAVIVPVYVPGATPAPTASDSVLVVPVTDAGLNVAVTPAGRPVDGERDCARESALTRERDVAGTRRTACCSHVRRRGRDALCRSDSHRELCSARQACRRGAGAAIVTLYVPGATFAPAVTVSCDVVFVPVTDVGAKATVSPAGAPSAVSAMSPVTPPRRATVIADVAVDPAASDSVPGARATVTPGAAFTVYAIVAVRSV